MGEKVKNFDFGPFKQMMLDKGISQEKVDACFGDLLVLLHATEDTGLTHAMTEGADMALHEIAADTIGLLRLSAAVLGTGNVLAHQPGVYGTPEFDVAWRHTRAAFASHGIELPENYRADVGNFRSAASCLLPPLRIADVQMAA